MAMYNTRKYRPEKVDEVTLLENNFSTKIDEINNLLDSPATPYNLSNLGPEFDEYDLHSCNSYSNASSSNSSSAYVQTNRYGRDNGNFKKYPLRSDKLFSVVPNLVGMPITTENISLKALSIGPDFYYKSNSHTIIDKMKTTVNYLQILSTDRELLEILVSKFNANCKLSLSETKRIVINEAYNIKMYYHHVMNLLESEYLSLGKMCMLLSYMSQTVLSNLITDKKIRKITIREEKDFQEILNDFLNAMNNLKKLNNLRIIKSDNFIQNIAEDEKVLFIAALDDMSFAIRQWHIMLWTIKEGICMIEIKSTEQFERFRNLFIGS